MATFITKFNIGDIVYHAGITYETKNVPCKNCLGKGSWISVSPAGVKSQVTCPECQGETGANIEMIKVPKVEKLTIGSVRINTADKGQVITYMCEETGIGSGTVYDENSLFPSENEALKESIVMIAQHQEND